VPPLATKVSTDWSRSAWKRLSLLKAGSQPDQLKITSFLQLIDDINLIITNNPDISCVTTSPIEHIVISDKENSFSLFFKRLIANAEKNIEMLPPQVRHNTLLKKFAMSLLIYCGPRAYNFISSNLCRAIPCLRTVQRSLAAEYNTFQEGEFRFNKLVQHIKRFNACNAVSLGEDATRVISRIQYDSDSDRLVGFILPCDNKGLPICDAFIATSFDDMEGYFKKASLAKYAMVYMVQPLTLGVPPFCLACIGTDNKFQQKLLQKDGSTYMMN